MWISCSRSRDSRRRIARSSSAAIALLSFLLIAGDQISSPDRLIDAVDGSVPYRVGRGPARRPVPMQRRPFVKSLSGVPGAD
jgi:hypothetical protein